MPEHDASLSPGTPPFAEIQWNITRAPAPRDPNIEKDLLFASVSHLVDQSPKAQVTESPDLGSAHDYLHGIQPDAMKVSLEPSERMKAFNSTTGSILAEAYTSFPEMTTVIPLTHGRQAGVDPDFFRANLRWLESEGFIKFNAPEGKASAPQSDHFTYTLTSKGLGVMTSTPSSLAAHQDLGAAMVEAVKKGAKDSLGDLAKEAIRQGVGFATRMALEHLPQHLR